MLYGNTRKVTITSGIKRIISIIRINIRGSPHSVDRTLLRNIVILAVAVVLLIQCNKKEPEEQPYPNESIVLDNAQGALYFHTVFREAENAWALIDSVDYKAGTYKDPGNVGRKTKEYTYEEDEVKSLVTIKYNAWVSNNLLLVGTIIVDFEKNSYRREGKIAKIKLSDFAINGQDVRGTPRITYNRKAAISGNDTYTYNLTDPSTIHEEGYNKPVLISGSGSGSYERIEGGYTFEQDDDVWTFSMTMKGRIRENPKLNYTNTVLATASYSYKDENGEEVTRENGKVHYTMNCKIAQHGLSQITIPGRDVITYFYFCSHVEFISVTDIH